MDSLSGPDFNASDLLLSRSLTRDVGALRRQLEAVLETFRSEMSVLLHQKLEVIKGISVAYDTHRLQLGSNLVYPLRQECSAVTDMKSLVAEYSTTLVDSNLKRLQLGRCVVLIPLMSQIGSRAADLELASNSLIEGRLEKGAGPFDFASVQSVLYVAGYFFKVRAQFLELSDLCGEAAAGKKQSIPSTHPSIPGTRLGELSELRHGTSQALLRVGDRLERALLASFATCVFSSDVSLSSSADAVYDALVIQSGPSCRDSALRYLQEAFLTRFCESVRSSISYPSGSHGSTPQEAVSLVCTKFTECALSCSKHIQLASRVLGIPASSLTDHVFVKSLYNFLLKPDEYLEESASFARKLASLFVPIDCLSFARNFTAVVNALVEVYKNDDKTDSLHDKVDSLHDKAFSFQEKMRSHDKPTSPSKVKQTNALVREFGMRIVGRFKLNSFVSLVARSGDCGVPTNFASELGRSLSDTLAGLFALLPLKAGQSADSVSSSILRLLNPEAQTVLSWPLVVSKIQQHVQSVAESVSLVLDESSKNQAKSGSGTLDPKSEIVNYPLLLALVIRLEANIRQLMFGVESVSLVLYGHSCVLTGKKALPESEFSRHFSSLVDDSCRPLLTVCSSVESRLHADILACAQVSIQNVAQIPVLYRLTNKAHPVRHSAYIDALTRALQGKFSTENSGISALDAKVRNRISTAVLAEFDRQARDATQSISASVSAQTEPEKRSMAQVELDRAKLKEVLHSLLALDSS